MQAFWFFLNDVLHAFDEENKILRKVRKVSNRAKYWKIFQVFFFIYVFPPHQKRVKKNNASFLNLLKKDVLHKFWWRKKILQAESFQFSKCFFLYTCFHCTKIVKKKYNASFLILENFPSVLFKDVFPPHQKRV